MLLLLREYFLSVLPGLLANITSSACRYRQILSQFDNDIRNPGADDHDAPELPNLNPIPIIGFSATFSRHDGLALGSVFQRIVYHRDFLEMIKEQWQVFSRFLKTYG